MTVFRILFAVITLWTACAFAQIGKPPIVEHPPNIPAGEWHFAVSGDSRNCGDVIMPAIADRVRSEGAVFYWHLGDYRLLNIVGVDQDMHAAYSKKHPRPGFPPFYSYYLSQAWLDFKENQLKKFGDLPVYLAVGNHETIVHKDVDRNDLLDEFSVWFNAPEIRRQRLADGGSDAKLHSYYHWHHANVDFITLDNASTDMFDRKQMDWFSRRMQQDKNDPAIRTVVLGMHAALPDSLVSSHSMNESARGIETGSDVYQQLLDLRKTGKDVIVLSSHAHVVLSDIYATACRKPEDVLRGWVVGTAGAERYNLPLALKQDPSLTAHDDRYGYLFGTVTADGQVSLEFREITQVDIPEDVVTLYGENLVKSCFAGNKANDHMMKGPNCLAISNRTIQ